jgi:ubiquinone/menaquinone biosynthesis C-methylase UbiE
MADKKILDVCCGGKMFYFDKNDSRVLFCDKRTLQKIKLCDGREFEVVPDVICDFTELPFQDNTYSIVVFDPPHMKEISETAYMCIKYGRLSGDWKEMLRRGFSECFRVLKPNGTLIFKWNEVQIPTSTVLALTDKKPVFGHISGKKSQTHWICFIKE